MGSSWRQLLREAKLALIKDLQADPYLRYILLLALLTTGFWFWHGVPNFVTPDEYGRLLRPMKAAGYFLAEPGFAGFARGATDGVAQGASFWLFSLTQLPVFVLVLLTGKFGAFVSLAGIESRWMLWHTVPAWFWIASISLARLANVGLATGTVYVLYRLGTNMRDMATGRMASLLLSLTLALIASAHEANEDTAMLFLLLLTLYLATRYVESGSRQYFLSAAFVGGLALAFKLTAGPVVFFVGLAFILRGLRSDEPQSQAFWNPQLLLLGALIGLIVSYLGRPNVLFTGPMSLLNRATGSLASKSQPAFLEMPPGFLLIEGYLAALGLPLFIAVVIGIFARASSWYRRRDHDPAEVLAFVGLVVFITVFATWNDIKPHHLLPTIPLAILLAAGPLAEISADRGTYKRVLVAALVVTTGLYAGVGTTQYAFAPRDQATDWLANSTQANATVVVYENSVADVAVVHGTPVTHYDFVEEVGVSNQVENESAYTEWMVESLKGQTDYVQVTAAEVKYLDPKRPLSDTYPERAAFIRRLLDDNRNGYEVAAEFGTPPNHGSYFERLFWAGIRPTPEKVIPYVVVLERNSTA